jgi:DNA-binding GntR family transcriptional regulator
VANGSPKRNERSRAAARKSRQSRTATKPKKASKPAKAAAPTSIVVPTQFSRPYWLAKILRERIISGHYPPGQRVREVDLRQEFGFSNGPIREALHLIVADGLAERAPWQGVRVISLDEKQILELFQVRLALLEYAAELAARRCTPEIVAQAEELKKTFERDFSKARRDAQHPSFHGLLSKWLIDAAGNEKLKVVWEKTMLQTLIYVNAWLQRNDVVRSEKLIERLIDAVIAQDVPAAREAARALTRQTLADLGIKEAI